MWPYLFSSRCGRILIGSYHMPDSVIGTVCVLWPDSAVEHVGGLCRVSYLTKNCACGLVHFNLIHTTCVCYISCICIYLGNFVFMLGCFFVFLFNCWIFVCFYLYLMFLSFFLFLMGKGLWWQREWKLNQKTIMKLTKEILQIGEKEYLTIIIDNFWADSSLL